MSHNRIILVTAEIMPNLYIASMDRPSSWIHQIKLLNRNIIAYKEE